MSKECKDKRQPSGNPRTSLTPDESRYWLAQLREARAKALADAEGFDAILFTLEGFGQVLCGEPGRGLGDYGPALKTLTIGKESHNAEDRRFETLFSMVRRVRNDAMHQGAIARNATALCVELALMLEDGLLAEATTVGDYMITAPVEAKLFESLGAIRRTLLTHSFSYLPVRDDGGQWKLVSDQALARHLQGCSNGERGRRLVRSLRESRLPLLDATQVEDGTPVSSVLDQLDSRPVLVVREVNGSSELVGLVTAFDLL